MAVAVPRKTINRRVRYEAEYGDSKKHGHAFFPYAMFHDVVVNLLVVLLIVGMAIAWHATADPINSTHPNGTNGVLGALYEHVANPAVQQTEPRPEWYFLFLFELLRIFKQPWQLLFATIIIPTILMILLVMWPFIDRGRDRRLSRRPKGVAFGLSMMAILIALTISGGNAPALVSGADISTNPQINALPGAALISSNACATCHHFPTGGASGPGGDLAKGSGRFGTDQAAIAAWVGGGASKQVAMPDFSQSNSPQQLKEIAQVIASLKTDTVQPLGGK